MELAREGAYTQEMLDHYLQLPALDPRIPELAERLTREAAKPISKALSVENYLKRNLQYSLQNLPGGSPDPLATFLFETQAGHCEYFASALALMLRTLAIPTRLINGFRRGEYNQWGDYFIVRGSHAHSWVEAYFPGAGWIEFDATPVPPQGDSYGVLTTASRIMDAIDVLWSEIVAFDRIKQAGFFHSVRSSLGSKWSRLSGRLLALTELRPNRLSLLMDWLGDRWIALICHGIFILAGLGLYRFRRHLRSFWRRNLRDESSLEMVCDYYLEMLHLLRSKGWVKGPSETPAEFGTRISRHLNSRLPSQITESYYRSRYGAAQLDSEEISAIRSGLRDLRRLRGRIKKIPATE
jgi:hypothetical protein